MEYTVIIPCYNSEKFLKNTVKVLVSEMDKISDDYEIILVNDGSRDGTFNVIKQIASEDKRVRGIDLLKNLGQHNAIIMGLKFGVGDVFINIDDDLQSNPEDISLLLEKLKNTNSDVVYANFTNKKYTIFKKFTSNLHNSITSWMLDKKGNWVASGFWVAKRYIIDEIIKYNSEYTDMQSNFVRTTDKIVNQDVFHHDRVYGMSGYTLSKAIKLWSSTLNYSEKPAILIVKFSVIFPIISFIVMLILHILKLESLTFFSVISLIFFSTILISIGYLGILASRILKIVSKVPFANVREKVGE